jgi:hypothetical protein
LSIADTGSDLDRRSALAAASNEPSCSSSLPSSTFTTALNGETETNFIFSWLRCSVTCLDDYDPPLFPPLALLMRSRL